MNVYSELPTQKYFLRTEETANGQKEGPLLYKKINNGTAMVHGRTAVHRFEMNEPIIPVLDLGTPLGSMFFVDNGRQLIRVVAISEKQKWHKPGEFYFVADQCILLPNKLTA